jgi:hypothetical protein
MEVSLIFEIPLLEFHVKEGKQGYLYASRFSKQLISIAQQRKPNDGVRDGSSTGMAHG